VETVDAALATEMRWWRRDRRSAALRFELLRLAVEASVPLTVFVGVLVVTGAVASLALSIAVAGVVADVPPAVAEGSGSAAADALARSVLVVGVLFVLRQATAPLLEPVADHLGLRVRSIVFCRTFDAMLRPATVAHLEDPELKDLVARAASPGPYGPRTAVRGLIGQWAARIGSVAGFVLVFDFHLWSGLLLAVAVVHAIRRLRLVHLELVRLQHNQTQTMRRAEYLRDLLSTPEPAKEIRIFGLHVWLVGRFDEEWAAAMRTVWARRQTAGRDALVGLLPVLLAAAVIAFVAGREVVAGDLGVEGLVRLAQGLVLACTAAGVTNHDSWVELGASAIDSMLELEGAVDEERLMLPGTDAAPRPTMEIRFEGVGFAYQEGAEPVFSNLDLLIRVGESLAIVGVNGSGKTTLLKLLARLYDPTSGRITVDGVDLRTFDPTGWQQQVAAIFQDFVRYPWTAEENITLGASVERSELESAAVKAGADTVASSLEEGWATVLSRECGGTDLSGGQWQRIALARALLASHRGAPILVLDEPTAHLDVRQESAFYDRFLSVTEGLTAIVISHRFSTVRRADRVVVLDQGRVVEDGTHADLVDLGGRYAAMFAAQADRFDEPSIGSPDA